MQVYSEGENCGSTFTFTMKMKRVAEAVNEEQTVRDDNSMASSLLRGGGADEYKSLGAED